MFDRLNGHTLAVGDVVAIVSSGGWSRSAAPTLDKVKRVLKRYVELEGKGLTYTLKYSLGGDTYPRVTGYGHSDWLEYPVTQEHRDAICRDRLTGKLLEARDRRVPDPDKYASAKAWEAYSTETLQAVVALLEKDLKR